MDPETIKTIATLVQGGGPVAMMFAVWIAFKAGQSAKEAVKAIQDMRDAVVETKPIVQQIAQDVKELDERSERIETSMSANGMKLDTLIARGRVA